MAKLFIEDLEVKGKRVLMRVDFNVPLTEDGKVADDSRIRAALPSIRFVLDHGGSLVLMSHLGRPKGKIVPSLSLRPVAERLSELLGRRVEQLDDCVGPAVRNRVARMQPGDVVLLENLRFHPEEKENDDSSAGSSPPSAISTSTTPSEPRTANMRPSWESPDTSPSRPRAT